MIKKLLLVFLVLGFFANSTAWGASQKKEDNADGEIAQWSTKIESGGDFIRNAYKNVMKIVKDATSSLKNACYNKMSSIMNSGIIYTLVGLIAFFWLWTQLKNGGSISKEQLYKAIQWIIIFVLVYVILGSRTAFNEILAMFQLPTKLLQEVFGGQGNVEQSIIKVFGEPFTKTSDVFFMLYNSFTKTIKFWGTQYIIGIPFAFALMLLYMLYLLVALAVMVGVVVIQSYSIFLEGIYASFAPLVILLLLIPQTKSIFFTWLKSYIGITLYVPLSGIAIKILAANPAPIPTVAKGNLSNDITQLFIFSATGLFLAILALTTLSKIPTWISELLGVQNQGVGMGGAMGMARMAGDAVGRAGMGGFSAMTSAAKGAGSAGKALGSAGKNLGSNLLNQTSGGQALQNAASAVGNKITGSSAGQAVGKASSVVRNGFQTAGRWLDTSGRNFQANKLRQERRNRNK